MKRLLNYLVLPGEVSPFEEAYLRRMNRIGLVFFALHVPVFVLFAYLNDTGPWLALGLSLAVLVGPTLAYLTFRNPRSVSLAYGVTAMLMGGILVHVGQGPVQIEMHFYFFALIAMLALYGNPLAVVAAAVTVALHHLLLWIWLPRSVFNYSAPVWVVVVHAAFVVLESIATCFIARSFFDNVIGLDKIVQARTRALDARNRDMRLVLDNVGEGFLTIGRDLVVSPEHSKILETWLGPIDGGMSFVDYLARKAPATAEWFRFGWTEVLEGVMPLELTIAQLPHAFTVRDRHYRLGYTPILRDGELEKALVVISDVTADVERGRLEAEQRDVLAILHRVAADKTGVLEFFAEAKEQVEFITRGSTSDVETLRRVVHTLKGNAMIFGLQTLADTAHGIESRIDEERTCPTAQERSGLNELWGRICASIELLLGEGRQNKLEIDDEEYTGLLRAIARGASREEIADRVANWKLEPTAKRLARVAEQARAMAKRLHKGGLDVEVSDNALRLDPNHWASFWSAFVHVVRNALDHGIEPSDQREERGKKAGGRLHLTTRVERNDFVIEIDDDGRGIDWAAVAERARERGIPHETQAELTEALFTDGLSTRSDVSEFSGRGIGMGAVRAACSDRGGVVTVHSDRSKGTKVEFRFPRTAMAPSKPPSAIAAE